MLALCGYTLYAIWLVLGILILKLLLGILKKLFHHRFDFDLCTDFLKHDILHKVVPLLALVYLMKFDPTGFVLLLLFFLLALCVFLKALLDMFSKKC